MPRYAESTKAAIKHAIDIVALLADYGLPAHRIGTKLKTLCPFHNDHNPSLELDRERQSYKCWSCNEGGDVFSFVMKYENVEFPEAFRMLADRAGVTLEPLAAVAETAGPSKSDLFAINAWAEEQFVEGLNQSDEAQVYLEGRGINLAMIRQFRLGFAPNTRDWLLSKARRAGFSVEVLDQAGLVTRSPENPQIYRERFRGRLLFPIHDTRGRTVAFGGRILPEIEKLMAEAGKGVAKYLNTSETSLFKKSRNLYGIDLARTVTKSAGWVGVVEGYTDVIAAHQVGLANIVGTLGTALTGDHVQSLRRLADRVVLVFDGDEAGQKAADRSLELFLSHEVDVRVLTLPQELDPCDFLLQNGSEPFLAMVDRAVDPLSFTIARATTLHDIDSPEGARQASERVLAVLAKLPVKSGAGLDVKVAKAIDRLSQQIRVPVAKLNSRLRELSMQAKRQPITISENPEILRPISLSSLDPIDLELIRILLNDPAVVNLLITRITVGSLRDAPLRAVLQASYDLHAEGQIPTYDLILSRLDHSADRDFAESLLSPMEHAPIKSGYGQAPAEIRLKDTLAKLTFRERQERIRDLQAAISETDQALFPEEYRALRVELESYYQQRTDTNRRSAS